MSLADSKLTTLQVSGDGTNDRAQGYVGTIDLRTSAKKLVAVDLANMVFAGIVLPPAGLKNDGVADVCVAGECLALVDGDTTDVAVGDLLVCTAAGTFLRYQAGIAKVSGTGTDDIIQKVRAVAMEANTGTAALKKVFIVYNPITAG